MDYQKIWNEAEAAAIAAGEALNAKLGPENARGLDCGFGWVTFKPANHPFIRWAKQNLKDDRGNSKVGPNYSGGSGAGFWMSYSSTQSSSVKYAEAKAMADVLKAHFPDAKMIYADSRLD